MINGRSTSTCLHWAVCASLVFLSFKCVVADEKTSGAAIPKGGFRHEPTRPRTALDLQKSHPDQIEADLKSIIESLSAAGLTDDVVLVSELLQRIRSQHRQRLLESFQSTALQPSEPRISLSVKWFEIHDDPAVEESLKSLIGNEESERQKSAGVAGIVSTVEILDAVNKLIDNGNAKCMVDQQLTIVNGREMRLNAGRRFIQSDTRDAQKIVWLDPQATVLTQSEKTTPSDPNAVFVGTHIQATAKIQKQDHIKLVVNIWHRALDSANLQEGGPKLSMQSESHNVEVLIGQSLVSFGQVSFSRNVAVAKKTPVLGDLPGIGPRMFTSHKVVVEQINVLSVITPTIEDATKEDLLQTGTSGRRLTEPSQRPDKAGDLSPAVYTKKLR